MRVFYYTDVIYMYMHVRMRRTEQCVVDMGIAKTVPINTVRTAPKRELNPLIKLQQKYKFSGTTDIFHYTYA